jgi:NitT/TauT family transport system substrate-binding protein
MTMFRPMLALLVAAVLVACGAPAATAPPSPPTDAPAAGAAAEPAALREVVMAMPYIPNVQFAHFYLADRKGYYAEEGLRVTFDYNYETDVVQRAAQGTVSFAAASGDSVLLARAQGLPVVTVATSSQRFPVVFYSKQAAGITTPADLRGKTVGIPGRFGASYIGLLALLYANQIPESDLSIQEIGFAQVAALVEDKVQVASGYGNNEPVQLAQQQIPVNVIRVADSFPLASDGIITSERLVTEEPELVRSFVRATLRGMRDVLENPDEAFQISLEYVSELKSADAATQELQRQVLQETLPYWQSDLTAREGLGVTDEASWRETHTFLRASGLLKQDVDVARAFTNEFVK